MKTIVLWLVVEDEIADSTNDEIEEFLKGKTCYVQKFETMPSTVNETTNYREAEKEK